MNNKGFAISGIFYSILIIFLVVITMSLFNLQSKKTLLDKLKADTVEAIECDSNYDSLLAEINKINDKIYPVGSIYMSMDSKNPTQIYGGTWKRVAQGRTLIGEGSNDGYTFTTNSTGTTLDNKTNPLGEYTHTLSITEIPSHSHSFSGSGSHSHSLSSIQAALYYNDYYRADSSLSTSYVGWIDNTYPGGTTVVNGVGLNNGALTYTTRSATTALSGNTSSTTVSISGTTGTAGGNGSHNNIQPYLVTYIWQRIS